MKNLLFLFLSIFLFSLNPTKAREKALPPTSVTFNTTDAKLQQLYNKAEELAAGNIIDYAGTKVLKEGAKYVSVWLETQPMGGYMYAKRNLPVAKNNIEIFMKYQREDGRLPGVIYNRDGVVTPNYVQFQGLYFAMPAYEMYFLLDKDTAYLNHVYHALKGFDNYLWKTRDSDGDGCLEAWCKYDNGEDGSVRFEGALNGWSYDFPPTKEFIDKLSPEELRIECKQKHYDPTMDIDVPFESMDVMSYSYACRSTLALISAELNNGQDKFWTAKADTVQDKLKSYLWDKNKMACYDRDKNNETMPVLVHNNLRCMHLGSFDQEMADQFIENHLVNPEEFWTPMPLPSISANDPLFRNISGNNWSGQPQGLTYQRSIRALENYGHYAELTVLGRKFLTVLQDSMKFTQQFDPFTAIINNSKDGYGPSILASLEFIGRFYGIHLTGDQIYWSAINSNNDFTYTQEWNGNSYELKTEGKLVTCSINGNVKFTFTKGVRVVTDADGNPLEVVGICPEETKVTVKTNKEIKLTVKPNTHYRILEKGKTKTTKTVSFFAPPTE